MPHLHITVSDRMMLVQSVQSNDGITMTEGVYLDDVAGFYARLFSNIDPRMQWRPGIFFLNQKIARHFLRRTEITANTSILGSFVLCRFDDLFSRSRWYPLIKMGKWHETLLLLFLLPDVAGVMKMSFKFLLTLVSKAGANTPRMRAGSVQV